MNEGGEVNTQRGQYTGLFNKITENTVIRFIYGAIYSLENTGQNEYRKKKIQPNKIKIKTFVYTK